MVAFLDWFFIYERAAMVGRPQYTESTAKGIEIS